MDLQLIWVLGFVCSELNPWGLGVETETSKSGHSFLVLPGLDFLCLSVLIPAFLILNSLFATGFRKIKPKDVNLGNTHILFTPNVTFGHY